MDGKLATLEAEPSHIIAIKKLPTVRRKKTFQSTFLFGFCLGFFSPPYRYSYLPRYSNA
jgi:hypothetical protein